MLIYDKTIFLMNSLNGLANLMTTKINFNTFPVIAYTSCVVTGLP